MAKQAEQITIKAAYAGGRVAKKYFEHRLKTHVKTGAADVYTRADVEAEQKIIGILRSEFPDYNIEAEETGKKENGSAYTFVIDPIDGTDNFTLGISYFTVAIALLKNREPILAVVYNPITKDLFTAAKGKGAYKNGRRLKAGEKAEIAGAVVAYVSGYDNETKLRPQVMHGLYKKNVGRVMDNWCPTLDYCLLASGKIDCVITNEDDYSESLIGWLFIKEAGGSVYDFQGKPITKCDHMQFVSVGNSEFVKHIVPILK